MNTQTKCKSILQVSESDVVAEPFPHLIKKTFVEPVLYEKLRAEFPKDELFDRTSKVGGRAGRDMYRGDEAYEELLATSPAWREFYDYIVSDAYVDLVIELFGKYLSTFQCSVDSTAARYVDYVEPRETLASGVSMTARMMDHLVNSKAKNDLFVRLDISQGGVGYAKPIHCDRDNRLTSMLVYFCDAKEIEMEGGELILHRHKKTMRYSQYNRHPDPADTVEIGRCKAEHNLGVLFLCSNNSYHSATAVTAQKQFRNFVYISISSMHKRIW